MILPSKENNNNGTCLNYAISKNLRDCPLPRYINSSVAINIAEIHPNNHFSVNLIFFENHKNFERLH